MPGTLLVVLLGFASLRPAAQSDGPPFWVARKGDATVYILGFGESRDTSWLTPAIRTAFQASSALWLETAGPNSSAPPQDESAKRAAAERMDKMAHESGRTLFDALEPPVRQRTLDYLAELGISPDSVKTFRPWRAYYTVVSGFYSKRKMPYDAVPVDGTLERMARNEGKTTGYEYPTREAFVTFMASMPDKAQSQYMEWLLDFLDDYKAGRNDEAETFGWIEGRNPPMRSLDRMRTRMPDLYQVMQAQRNLWWARKIEELLAAGGTSFVAVGQLHVLGPDGIPHQLEKIGVQPEKP
ncbi:MAG TPA: TraB/GumN family protein [Gemmatimonadales bacterium]|nr:TraB/GumN family protein [Gemmatimonadales bacterium]